MMREGAREMGMDEGEGVQVVGSWLGEGLKVIFCGVLGVISVLVDWC